MRLAQVAAIGGQLHLYRVVTGTGETFGARQVAFAGGVSAWEADSLKAWPVQFTLSECESHPEKVEGRRAGNPVSAQDTPDSAMGDAGTANLSATTLYWEALKRCWAVGVAGGSEPT
jgi:hypothetical protein